ncbi:MAG: O-antigen ligase family protein [Methylobacter sp.]|nr:O-antigen ligase family protein [Methylobacter sp.]
MLLTWLVSGQVWSSLKISAGQPAGKMLLLFFAWLIISSLYADTSWTDKVDTLSSWKKLFFTFVLFGLFYQPQWKARFIYCYLAAMSLAAVIAIPLWLQDIHVRSGREAGIFMTNHSSQSLAFVVAALCCIYLLKESLSWQKKCLLVGVFFLFLINIFFISPSRSGYLALPVAAAFAFVNLFGYKKLQHVHGIIAGALLLVVLTSSTLQQRIKLGLEEKTNYQTSENITSIGIRVVFAQNTLELIRQKPLLGYGTSSFKSVYGSHVAAKYQDWRGVPASDPHNQYLFVWLENGLVGLVLFLAYIFTAIRQGASQQPYGAIAASVLVAIAATSLFNSNFKTFPEGHLLAFFVGCLLARQPKNKAEEERA